MKIRETLLLALVGCVAWSGAAHASDRGNAANAKRCQKGGWQTLKTGDGGLFTSEEACVAYAAQGGSLFRPMLVAVPTEVVEDQGIDLYATGFHPNASSKVKIEDFGGGSIELFALTDENGSSHFTSVFTSGPDGACANGLSGAQYTFTDSFGLTATVAVTLDCN
jgi:hypothetical protein